MMRALYVKMASSMVKPQLGPVTALMMGTLLSPLDLALLLWGLKECNQSKVSPKILMLSVTGIGFPSYRMWGKDFSLFTLVRRAWRRFDTMCAGLI
jgi:hypothetical protein